MWALKRSCLQSLIINSYFKETKKCVCVCTVCSRCLSCLRMLHTHIHRVEHKFLHNLTAGMSSKWLIWRSRYSYCSPICIPLDVGVSIKADEAVLSSWQLWEPDSWLHLGFPRYSAILSTSHTTVILPLLPSQPQIHPTTLDPASLSCSCSTARSRWSVAEHSVDIRSILLSPVKCWDGEKDPRRSFSSSHEEGFSAKGAAPVLDFRSAIFHQDVDNYHLNNGETIQPLSIHPPK